MYILIFLFLSVFIVGFLMSFEDAKKRCLDSTLKSEYNEYTSSIIVSKKVTYEN